MRGVLSLVGSKPIDWGAPRQTSSQTATCGTELIAIKLDIIRAVSIRYHLRAIGVNVNNPTSVCCYNKTVVTNTTTDRSILSKKNLALAYHFCREHFSAEIVDIRWGEGRKNVPDFMTKALTTGKFHSHISRPISCS